MMADTARRGTWLSGSQGLLSRPSTSQDTSLIPRIPGYGARRHFRVNPNHTGAPPPPQPCPSGLATIDTPLTYQLCVDVLQVQTALLRSTLGEDAVFDYLEGGRPWPEAEVDPLLRRMFGEGPYYGWYAYVYPFIYIIYVQIY